MSIIKLTPADTKARIALNDKAVESARAGALDLQKAAASGMYMLMHGHSHFINDLYRKLNDDISGSPKDAQALRSMYAPLVIDKFGKGGIRKADDENVWLRRPVPFFKFSSALNEQKQAEGFSLVDVKNNTALTVTDIKHIKAARAEIRQSGEDALNFLWKTRQAEEREAEEMSASKMQNAVAGMLTRIAKSAHTNGATKGMLSMTARTFGLTSDQATKVLNSYNDGSVNTDVVDDEFSENQTELIHTDQEASKDETTNEEIAETIAEEEKKEKPAETLHA